MRLRALVCALRCVFYPRQKVRTHLLHKKNGIMTRRRTRNGFDEDDARTTTTTTATTPEEERDTKRTLHFNGTVRPFVASEHPVTPAVRYAHAFSFFSPTEDSLSLSFLYNELTARALTHLLSPLCSNARRKRTDSSASSPLRSSSSSTCSCSSLLLYTKKTRRRKKRVQNPP